MFAAQLIVTLLASALTGSAALANFTGHDYPKSQADKLGVPHSWMPLLGTLLAAGSLGMLAGFAVPPLGALASAGLVLYFVGALVVHVRVRDFQLGPWAVFTALPAAALVLNLARHGL